MLGIHLHRPSVTSLHWLLGTSLQGATAVWNVIDGERNKIRVVAFDCRIGVGKGSWTANYGNETANHYDHVHIATDGGGYPTGHETYYIGSMTPTPPA